MLRYAWFYNGQPLVPTDKIKFSGGNLTIHNLNYVDAGMYQCIPKNKHGKLYSALELKVAGKGRASLQPANRLLKANKGEEEGEGKGGIMTPPPPPHERT